jgi:hypothetical protein
MQIGPRRGFAIQHIDLHDVLRYEVQRQLQCQKHDKPWSKLQLKRRFILISARYSRAWLEVWNSAWRINIPYIYFVFKHVGIVWPLFVKTKRSRSPSKPTKVRLNILIFVGCHINESRQERQSQRLFYNMTRDQMRNYRLPVFASPGPHPRSVNRL